MSEYFRLLLTFHLAFVCDFESVRYLVAGSVLDDTLDVVLFRDEVRAHVLDLRRQVHPGIRPVHVGSVPSPPEGSVR